MRYEKLYVSYFTGVINEIWLLPGKSSIGAPFTLICWLMLLPWDFIIAFKVSFFPAESLPKWHTG
jgi:hypothetical protein